MALQEHRRRFHTLLLVLVVVGAGVTLSRPTVAASLIGSDDSRLKQRVTTRTVDFPLRAWLSQVSRETGVAFRTAPGYEDRAITVRVADVSLADLMHAVATLFGDTWRARREKETAPYRYVLEPSLTRRNKQREFFQTYLSSLQTDLVNTVRHVAEHGPMPWQVEEVRDEPEGGRNRYQSEQKERARVLSLLGDRAIEYLLNGGRFRIQLAEAQGKLGEALWDFVETFALPAAGGATRQDRASAWVEFWSRPYILTDYATGLPLRDLYFTIGGPGGPSSGHNAVVHPEAFRARLMVALNSLRRGEKQDPEDRRRLGGDLLRRVLPDAMKPQAGTPVFRSELLIALADAANLNVVSDSHTKPPLPAPPCAGRTVEDALTALCAQHGCYWRIERSLIRVRSAYWALDDTYEPPATPVARWQTLLRERRTLDLADACQIASLSVEQRERMALRIPEARSAFNPWLRLYERLDPAQRQALRSSKGLRVESIPAPLRLQITTSDPWSNPFFGRLRLEQTLSEGPATLRMSEERGPGNRPAVLFQLDPLADPHGHPHLQGSPVRIFLPARIERQQPAARPPQSKAGQ